MYNIKSKKTTFTEISPESKVKLTFSDDYAEIKATDKEHDISNYRRISHSKYCNIKTGEIGEYSTTFDNKKSDDSIRKTFNRAKELISMNFSGGKSEVFLTLCYDYTMSDTDKLNKDYISFRKKLDRRFPNCKYITIVEYKNNGSLHLHIFLKSGDNKQLFIDRDLLIKLWKQKSVYVQRINTKKDVFKLINYTNPFTNQHKYKQISYYKRGARILRPSQNITRPNKLTTSYEHAMDIMYSNNYMRNSETAYDVMAITNGNSAIKLNSIKKINFTRRNYI